MEIVECSICLAEPAVEEDGTIVLDGWLEGEYGWMCPECVVLEAPPGQTAGVAAVAEAAGAVKKDK